MYVAPPCLRKTKTQHTSPHLYPSPPFGFTTRPPPSSQGFIQRAGPEILVRDLPPKLEVVLELAPTPLQVELLTRLLDSIGRHGKNTLRDTEVG